MVALAQLARWRRRGNCDRRPQVDRGIGNVVDLLVLDHHALRVPDLDGAIEWYGRVFGFSVVRRFTLTAAHCRCAMLIRDALRLELEHFSIKKHHIRSERSSFCTLRG
ncbi:hypothetical protein EWE75_23100 [Sphingomonas populi]|uniref:VOC domain-containing protein n=1 Tax=Sphingomonas populi TaxID=2484750 RepID=A0A4Q6XR70_9SPHN|nr:hypothetical protein EWE75_23100 [Sphingomonas populi]